MDDGALECYSMVQVFCALNCTMFDLGYLSPLLTVVVNSGVAKKTLPGGSKCGCSSENVESEKFVISIYRWEYSSLQHCC